MTSGGPASAPSSPQCTCVPVRWVESSEDAGLEPYRRLKDGDGVGIRAGGFIAEGPDTLRLMLASDARVHSVLLKPSTLQGMLECLRVAGLQRMGGGQDGSEGGAGSVDRAECFLHGRWQGSWPFQVMAAPSKLIAQVVGMEASRGALGFGVPPAYDLSAVLDDAAGHGGGLRVLAVDDSRDDPNVGSMVRTASCLGADAVLLSRGSAGCWTRRAVRTSMGHCFRVPVLRCDLPDTLRMLEERYGVQPFAAVIDEDARALDDIPRGGVPARWCVVVGAEDTGVGPGVREVCGEARRVRIWMAPGVDSLNIGVAAAVLLNGFREREAREGLRDPGAGAAK